MESWFDSQQGKGNCLGEGPRAPFSVGIGDSPGREADRITSPRLGMTGVNTAIPTKHPRGMHTGNFLSPCFIEMNAPWMLLV